MATEVTAPEDRLQLQAVSGDQMMSAHEQMRAWITDKIGRLQADLREEVEALEIAERNKWAVSRHRRRVREVQRRIEFFHKIDAAVEAGYVIIPNFQMDVFAIRTDRANLARNTAHGGSWAVSSQSARVLPAGDGEYRNPQTETQTDEFKVGDRTERRSYAVGDWQDIDFPFALAKPSLMSRTAEALALKCFDEIGVVHDRGVTKGDPYIIGRIRNPGRRSNISFFIGWFFDPSAL